VLSIAPLARNVRRLAHLDLPGAGQVTVDGDHAYVGHIPNKDRLGTTILDISNPRDPRIAAQIVLEDRDSHSHKARVAGDVMIVNHERNNTGLGRKADQLPVVRDRLGALLGREPSTTELADKLGVRVADIAVLEEAARNPYDRGGFKLYDVSDPARPGCIGYQKTFGAGVHRFDMDENYAYISTEMAGYVGNILVIYDIRDPRQPREVSRWWMPGQHVAGGETPIPEGREHRLHHALRFGDELWAGVWHAGLRVVDVADPHAPREIASFIPEPVGDRPAAQSNDVDVDERGLIYLVDRNVGFDVLELERRA
jgi:hypothetical protein